MKLRTARRDLIIAAAAAYTTIGIIRFPAGAAEFSYKLANNFPPTFPLTAPLADAAEKIAHDSGGRLEIKIFGSGQLGGNVELVSQLRLGALEILVPPYTDIATVVPVAGLASLPFIATDHKQGVNLISGRLGSYVQAAISKIGINQLPGSWDIGFLQTVNSVRPITLPADMRALKVRTTNSPVEIAVFKALGAQPTLIAATEIYPGLQTHLIDGATLPIASIDSFRLYEVAKYVSYTNHGWLGFTVLVNGAAWQRLPKNLQEIAARNFEAARIVSNAGTEKGDAPAEAGLKAKGMAINNVDVPAFRKAVRDAGLYAQWKSTYPPEAWSLLQAQVGPLG